MRKEQELLIGAEARDAAREARFHESCASRIGKSAVRA
jgi:hypothetical protein